MQTNIKKLTILLALSGLVACNSGAAASTADNTSSANLVNGNASIQASSENTKGSIKVMATGQKTSYAPSDDGELQPGGEVEEPRFVSGVGEESDCIIDKTTGFMWPKNGKLFAKTSWEDNLNKINVMNSSSSATAYKLCGHTDWRMPNTNELETLLNYAESSNAAWLEAQGFQNIDRKDMYWSSTSYNLDEYCAHDMAYATNLDSGVTGGRNKSKVGEAMAGNYFQYSIPVRTSNANAPYQVPATGQSKVIKQFTAFCPGGLYYTSPNGSDGDLQKGKKLPTNRFTKLEDSNGQCIKDNLTGLVWFADGSRSSKILQDAYTAMGDGVKANGITWDNVVQYGLPAANTQKLCGRSNWRLPSIREARSLYNYDVIKNADYLGTFGFIIDSGLSTGSWYMTSTPFAYKGQRSTIIGHKGISAWEYHPNVNLTGDEGQNGDQGIMKYRDLQNVLLVSGGQTLKPTAKIKPALSDKVIFITQDGYTNFGGVANADAICDAEAIKPGSLINKRAKFKAMLLSSNRYPCNSKGICGVIGASDWPIQANATYTTVGNNGKISSNPNGILQNYPAGLIRDQFGYQQNKYFWTGINGVLLGQGSDVAAWSYANQDGNWTKIINGKSTSTLSGAWSRYADLTAADWTFPSNIKSAVVGDNGFYPDTEFGKSVGTTGFGYATKNATVFDSASRWVSKNQGLVAYSYWTGPQVHIMCVQQ